MKQEELNSCSISSSRVPAKPVLSFQSLPLPAVGEYGLAALFEPQTKDQGCASQPRAGGAITSPAQPLWGQTSPGMDLSDHPAAPMLDTAPCRR